MQSNIPPFVQYLFDIGYKCYSTDYSPYGEVYEGVTYKKSGPMREVPYPKGWSMHETLTVYFIKEGEEVRIYWGYCEALSIRQSATLRIPLPNFRVIERNNKASDPYNDMGINCILKEFPPAIVYKAMFDPTTQLCIDYSKTPRTREIKTI